MIEISWYLGSEQENFSGQGDTGATSSGELVSYRIFAFQSAF
jgi:hypothetical protein